jgi:hypothetical protein
MQEIQVLTFGRGLGEEAQATPRRPSYSCKDEGRDSAADGSFAGEVEGVRFRHASVSTAEGSSQSCCLEDTQVFRLKTCGCPRQACTLVARVLSV